MDDAMFCSPSYQRVYQYLLRCIAQINLDQLNYHIGSVEGNPINYLKIILR